MIIKKQRTKTLAMKANKRSADITSPNFLYFCGASCRYCYCKRNPRFRTHGYINENMLDILAVIDKWANEQPYPKIPNQVHETMYGVDIANATDISRHYADYNWSYVFDWFKDRPKIFPTFATKFVNNKLLKHTGRIRFSLMPQEYSSILEPGTTPIHIRIKAIDRFIEHGWDVNINLSPVIYRASESHLYRDLFEQIAKSKYLDRIQSEVIFLTHDKGLHEYNLVNYPEAEELLWQPDIQEIKNSQHRQCTLRYEHRMKAQLINQFTQMYNEYIPEVNIRYIF